MENGRCAKNWELENVIHVFNLKKKADSKNCIQVALVKIQNGLLKGLFMRSQKEKLPSPEGSKILPTIGHISLRLYQNVDFNNAFYKVSYDITNYVWGREDVNLININHSQSRHPPQRDFQQLDTEPYPWPIQLNIFI